MRDTFEIKRKLMTTFSFCWAGMFFEGRREKIEGDPITV